MRQRADERDAVVGAQARDVGTLGEETIARVQRRATTGDCRLYDRIDIQAAFARMRTAQRQGATGASGRQRVPIRRRDAQHGLKSQPVARLNDPQCDFAAVGDEDLVLHDGSGTMLNRTWPNSTSWPSAACTAASTPDWPAHTEFISFITSTMQRTVSRSTRSPTLTKGASPGLGR